MGIIITTEMGSIRQESKTVHIIIILHKESHQYQYEGNTSIVT